MGTHVDLYLFSQSSDEIPQITLLQINMYVDHKHEIRTLSKCDLNPSLSLTWVRSTVEGILVLDAQGLRRTYESEFGGVCSEETNNWLSLDPLEDGAHKSQKGLQQME